MVRRAKKGERSKPENTVQKKIITVFLLFALLAVIAWRNEKCNPILKEGNRLERRQSGEGDYEAALIWNTNDGKEREVTVVVPEQTLSQDGQKALLKAAEAEIEKTFPGENASMEEIYSDVCPKETYQNEAVTAEWSFDSYEFIRLDGQVLNEEIGEDGTIVKAAVLLSCQDTKETYEFFFRICPKQYTTEEKMKRRLQEQFLAETGQETTVFLPDTIDGEPVVWKEKDEKIPVKLLFLGGIAAACIPLIERSKRQEDEKRRQQQLKTEYPELVSRLIILLGAGMTLFTAWKKITDSYLEKRQNNQTDRHPLYEEMVVTCHEIKSGVSEIRAYERFGERCGLHQYRKFCSLLTQNLKKGTKGLIGLLEKEASEAFEERKNSARKSGEEAGTKMLFPMMLMFAIVLVIIMVPAMMSLQ